MAKALSVLDCEACELSLVFTDNEGIAALNERYLKRRGPTNVIAFPMLDTAQGKQKPGGMLGDIVISLERAGEEANAAGVTLPERVDRLLVHGLLHLLGYDHEESPAAGTMQRAEARLMAVMAGKEKVVGEKVDLIKDF